MTVRIRAPRSGARPRRTRCARIHPNPPRIAVPLDPRAALPVILLALAACVAPAPPLLSDPDADPAVPARDDAEGVRAALELAELGPTVLRRPDPDALDDPRADAFWATLAAAWNPEVRQRRRAWLADREARRSAGAPLPVFGQAVDHDLVGEGMTEVVATFDLIGLLGLGPSAAAKDVADATSLRSLSGLEASTFSAQLDVLRGRIALAAVRARRAAVGALLDEARADLVRFEILDRTGRLADGQRALAVAGVQQLEHRHSGLVDEESRARAELARRAGLPVAHPALDAPDPDTLARLAARPAPDLPADVRRVDTHPGLRGARLDFALAEARVRAAAAAAWPGVQLGPHLNFQDGTTVGGVLRLSLPWPSAWRGELAAAEQRREGAREAFEDRWLGLLADEGDARTRLAEVERRQRDHTAPLLEARGTDWGAMRARFRVGRATPMEWSDALMRSRQVVTLGVDDVEARALALCDLAAALGPAALGSWRDASADESRERPDVVGEALAAAEAARADARSNDTGGTR